MPELQIDGESALRHAITQLVRADATHDPERRQVIERARALDFGGLIPDTWAPDGALRAQASTWADTEARETWNDLYAGLQSALDDLTGEDWYYIWVQDFTATEVIFSCGGDLYSAPYTVETGGPITIGDRVRVRPVTEYVETGERAATPMLEWRKKKAQEMQGRTLERRRFAVSDMELREQEDGTLHLSGYASVTDTPYQVGFYTETIKRGAFKRTLGENPDVQLLINHEGLPLARTRSGTLTLTEDERGLKVDADLDAEDPDVQSLARKMKRGDIDQMSFAFQPTDQDWNADFTDRVIKAVSIHRGDVSVVNQGANAASTATLRSQAAITALRAVGSDGFLAAWIEWRDHTLLSLEERAGRTLSADTMEVLSQVLNLIAAADDAVDEAQPLLAVLMGVPNPDAEETAAAEDEDDETEETDTAERAAVPNYTTGAVERLAVLRAGRSR